MSTTLHRWLLSAAEPHHVCLSRPDKKVKKLAGSPVNIFPRKSLG